MFFRFYDDGINSYHLKMRKDKEGQKALLEKSDMMFLKLYIEEHIRELRK